MGYTRQAITLFGMTPIDCGVEQYMGENRFIYGPPNDIGKYEVFASMTSPAQPATITALFRMGFEETMRLPSEFTVSKLGDTVICKHCHFASKPGAITCHRCGGVLRDTIQASRYDKVGVARITNITKMYSARFKCDGSDIEYPSYSDVEIQIQVCGDDYTSIFGGWQTSHEQDGWICQYCNCINDNDDIDCQYCSAGRLPFSDMLKMPHNCLYCGTKLRGATVCPKCASAKNGYAVWPARYAMAR